MIIVSGVISNRNENMSCMFRSKEFLVPLIVKSKFKWFEVFCFECSSLY